MYIFGVVGCATYRVGRCTYLVLCATYRVGRCTYLVLWSVLHIEYGVLHMGCGWYCVLHIDVECVVCCLWSGGV